MDVLGFLDVPLWLLLLLTCAILLYVYAVYPFSVWTSLGVPGPRTLPFLGNVAELVNPKVGTRATWKKWQEQYGRVCGFYMFRAPALLVSDTEALKQILVKDFNSFADRNMDPDPDGGLVDRLLFKSVFFAGGSDWRRIRKIITPTFSSGKLKCLTGYINNTAQCLSSVMLKHADKQEEVDAKTVFAAFSLDVICGAAFGVNMNLQDDPHSSFHSRVKSLLAFGVKVKFILSLYGAFPFLLPIMKWFKLGPFKRSDIQFFTETISDWLAQRKEQPEFQKREDFLQFLLNAEADSSDGFTGEKKLTSEEIVAQGMIFLTAGYDTTSSTLQFLSYELASHYDIQKKLFAEIQEVIGEDEEVTFEHCNSLKYMEAVIQEALRMYPPVHILNRRAVQKTDLLGTPVPPETIIYVPVFNIGRDPEFFPDPNTFDPDRFLDERRKEMNPMTLLTFGLGPRQCIGMRLAMMEMKIALVHVMRKVVIHRAIPKLLQFDDYTGILYTRTPIKLTLRPK